MKKLATTIAVVLCSIWITSCSNAASDSAKETSEKAPTKTETVKTTSTTTENKIEATNKKSHSQAKSDEPETNATAQPQVGTIKEMVNGDLKCYVTLVDDKGTEHNLGATFEVCEKPETFLNKKVSLTYKIESVSDCQSAEPCGKTKKESLISQMEIQK
ncbi:MULTISPECIES: hypothetical protein [unclassified Tolypothrix]|uniref:hypothetical protein n=1 Tax=unclassified Tolypothrix TaxID=2649714 RepID=UPI0005EAAA57|nr:MULTISPECIES: hypothetical protein [unclassified Tolypothrix]BAY92912.1 hypothetical protein NIES3275_49490 [Microchaete diplosiphon NIES-3275]EKF03016.1 hypothetical protein FDUTEX481_05819 [Tolypothrix sp. PCC 7601]MBE9086607.1 hypothetical protein [Tolypothrix sp. LEGE 11397]UYD26817.1 hypothetical protein HGR01_01490 [Tolypothrix sp. PCC 7712]UYD37326.1 hypothetical protein HG267_17325 [Tolypothrix sp. PCC 7601]